MVTVNAEHGNQRARGRTRGSKWTFVAALCALALPVPEAAPQDGAAAQGEMLLSDEVGNAVATPISRVEAGLRPATALGLKYQTPGTHKGVTAPSETQKKLESIWEGLPEFEFFPPAPPRLMPYLYETDAQGNTAATPGALLGVAPLVPEVQQAKYWVSGYGLRYKLEQTFSYAGMSDVAKGESDLAKYNLNLPLKWTVFDARTTGTAGWLSAQIEFQGSMGTPGSTQTAKTNLDTLTNPTGIWSTHSSFRVPEVAWQQSFDAGHIVALAGVINQANYLDANSYANNGRGQFINSALINSMVLPLPAYNYGFNLQWQPRSDWYTLLGYSVGNAGAGENPGTNFSWANWSLEWEVGYASDDVLGLGPGVYRVQPFIGRSSSAEQADGQREGQRAASSIQGGLAFNLQQRLGASSPFGWFGRLGFANSEVSGGARHRRAPGSSCRPRSTTRVGLRSSPTISSASASSGASPRRPSRPCITKTSTCSKRTTRFSSRPRPGCSRICRSCGTRDSTPIRGPWWCFNSSFC
jgi:hypothetical protein